MTDTASDTVRIKDLVKSILANKQAIQEPIQKPIHSLKIGVSEKVKNTWQNDTLLKSQNDINRQFLESDAQDKKLNNDFPNELII